MAICVFRLTRNRRFHLALAFTILDVIQVLLGLFLTCHAIYVYATVTPGMSTERAEVTFVFAVTAMYGTHVIFHYLAGIRICEKCFKQSHKLDHIFLKKIQSILQVWNTKVIISKVYGMLMTWFVVRGFFFLKQAIKTIVTQRFKKIKISSSILAVKTTFFVNEYFDVGTNYVENT